MATATCQAVTRCVYTAGLNQSLWNNWQKVLGQINSNFERISNSDDEAFDSLALKGLKPTNVIFLLLFYNTISENGFMKNFIALKKTFKNR